MNSIKILDETYLNEAICRGDVYTVESLTGDELQFDTMSVTVEGDLNPFSDFITADREQFVSLDYKEFSVNTNKDWKYGDPVYYKRNGELFGKFYMEKFKRVGQKEYQFDCISAIGLLEKTQHYGGIYFGVTMAELLEEIIGGEIEYTLDAVLAKQPIYGWLPIASRRENLHQLLFAMSASVKKDAEGNVFITTLTKDTASDIPDSRIFRGGSIEYPQSTSKVSLSEHAYIQRADDETVTLYDGEISADSITTPLGVVVRGGLVLFDSPAHDLIATGTEIIESGVNYAVLSPSAECQLVGQKYTHTVRQVTRPETPTEGDTNIENKITISNATLVSIANSENVAERLKNYYSSAKSVTMDIAVQNEKVGDVVTFSDPYNEDTEGIITSLDSSISNVLRARVEVAADYEPPNAGNFYNNVAVITDGGVWQVPGGVEKIRLVLIGGGQGGSAGSKGADGEEIIGYGEGGKGGEAGKGGKGGKIYITTVEVIEGKEFEVLIGEGGIGGVCTGSGSYEGEEGTATTFGEYSSDSGTISSIGFTEMFEGVNYGTIGLTGAYNGADGGKAAKGGDIVHEGITYSGGAAGTTGTRSSTSQTFTYYGGGGGGAAACVNGGDGNDRAKGGDGANATLAGANAIIAGAGGQGGCGGGGGGGSGYEVAKAKSSYEGDTTGMNYSWYGEKGVGGLGSAGGKGANGCVIIYY